MLLLENFIELKKKNKTSIIVFAKKEKFKNLIVYCVVNNILNKHIKFYHLN